MEIQQFSLANLARCQQSFRHCWNHDILYFPLAACGEAGEAANIIKKLVRGDYSIHNADYGIQKRNAVIEFVDCITYCDLAIQRLGYQTESLLIHKFNQVSVRVDSPIRLE